jgi:hypothetical protein
MKAGTSERRSRKSYAKAAKGKSFGRLLLRFLRNLCGFCVEGFSLRIGADA